MSGLSAAAKMQALRSILAGPLYVGLGYAVNGMNIEEVGDAAYARQPVAMGEPEIVGAAVVSVNTEDVLFPPWAADDTDPVRYWFITGQQSGETTIIAFGQLDPEPDGSFITPRQGGTLRFLPGDLSLGLTDPVREQGGSE